MQEPNDPETSPLLGLKHGRSRDRARRYFSQPIRLQNAYFPLLVCCFITGLIDAGSYNAWRVFMSMQTGNTIFLALSTANLPAGSDSLQWARSGISILSLSAGSMVTGRIYAAVGATRRLTLLISFLLQALCVATAALLVHTDTVPVSTIESKLIFIAIPFLSAQSGVQIVTAKSLGFPEIPTTVLTTTYNDLAGDTELFARRNPKRNRRIGAITMMLLGGISAGWLFRLGDLTLVLWLGAGLKFLVALSWLGYAGDEAI